VLSSWGLNLHNQGKLDSAEIVMRHGIAVFDSAGKGPSFEEAGYLMTLASHLLSKGKAAAALPVAERARDMARVTVQPIHTMQVQIGMLLAGALGEVGDSVRSDSVAAAALALFPKLPPGSEIYQFLGVWTHARTLWRARRLERAEAAARWQYDLANRTARGFPHYMSDAEYLLGGVLVDRGKFSEAEPHVLESYRIANEKFGASHPRTIRGAKELALLYRRWGKEEQSAKYLALLPAGLADSVRRAAPQ
jgi:hypothetical protein